MISALSYGHASSSKARRWYMKNVVAVTMLLSGLPLEINRLPKGKVIPRRSYKVFTKGQRTPAPGNTFEHYGSQNLSGLMNSAKSPTNHLVRFIRQWDAVLHASRTLPLYLRWREFASRPSSLQATVVPPEACYTNFACPYVHVCVYLFVPEFCSFSKFPFYLHNARCTSHFADLVQLLPCVAHATPCTTERNVFAVLNLI